MKQSPKRTRLLAFLPAAIVIGVVAGTAAGISIIPSATAADLEVTGSVDATISTPATPPGGQTGAAGTCNSVTPTGGSAASFAITAGWESAAVVTGACSVNFGSTNGQIQLTYQNANAGSAFYCNHPGGGARDCTAGVDNVGNVDVNGQIDANEFGISVHSTMTNAVPGTGFVGNDTPTAGANIWRPIPNNASPAQLCRSSAAGDGTCIFHLGVRGKGANPLQNNGNYSGRLQLTAAQL